jgi:hypothetical protein
MITFRQHIGLMEHLSKGGSPESFIKELKPLEALYFIRNSENTYPVKKNIKKHSSDKKIYLRVDSLVLGQFIMLEQIITGKTKLADHQVDLEIAKLVIRPSSHQVFDNEDLEAEKVNTQDILDMDVLEVYWVLEHFIENRNHTLFKEFSGVFYDLKEEEDEEEDVEDSEEVVTSNLLFSQQWYWYSIVRMLANEDITKYNEIYMLSMSVVLPEMSYIAQRSKIESAKERQQQSMRKL